MATDTLDDYNNFTFCSKYNYNSFIATVVPELPGLPISLTTPDPDRTIPKSVFRTQLDKMMKCGRNRKMVTNLVEEWCGFGVSQISKIQGRRWKVEIE